MKSPEKMRETYKFLEEVGMKLIGDGSVPEGMAALTACRALQWALDEEPPKDQAPISVFLDRFKNVVH